MKETYVIFLEIRTASFLRKYGCLLYEPSHGKLQTAIHTTARQAGTALEVRVTHLVNATATKHNYL